MAIIALLATCSTYAFSGSADEPKFDEDGNEVEDEDKPPLPAFPKYSGLGFTPSNEVPSRVIDEAFPPADAPVLPGQKLASFTTAMGVIEAS